ncbi:F-box domain-containing protein [Mycena indigotica]|uniref:F-box domain-containing protein n=1 Tax=Mycena indigotica TaxID=2126181 RepID=A0A8H6SB50_9AGAR|nr:F-box domain-containing protein [Mycena indigotica]KAF7295688.1 F-box domain-containing protein [Mycena indigotica]
MSPDAKLANELLAEVFERYIPTYPTCPPFRGDGSPTTLAQVCSRWRSVAHGTPALWRAVKLDLIKDIALGMTRQTRLDIAQTWLERSYPLPLSIVFRCPTNRTLILAEAFAMLLSYSSHWQYANIMVPAALPVQMQAKGERRDMPMLVGINVDVRSNDTEPHLGLLHVPALQTFIGQLTDDSYYLKMITSDVWRNLTTLKLRDIALADAAPILSQTQALVKLWLDIWNPATARMPAICLPNLETMILEGGSEDDEASVLINALTLPALRCLGFPDDFISVFAPGATVTYVQGLLRLVTTLGCGGSLTKLAMSDCYSSRVLLMDDILAALPSVRRLYLKRDEWPLAVEDLWDSKTVLEQCR